MKNHGAAISIINVVIGLARSPHKYPKLTNQQQHLPDFIGYLLEWAQNLDEDFLKQYTNEITLEEFTIALSTFLKNVLFVNGADQYRILGLNKNAGHGQFKKHCRLLIGLYEKGVDYGEENLSRVVHAYNFFLKLANKSNLAIKPGAVKNVEERSNEQSRTMDPLTNETPFEVSDIEESSEFLKQTGGIDLINAQEPTHIAEVDEFLADSIEQFQEQAGALHTKKAQTRTSQTKKPSKQAYRKLTPDVFQEVIDLDQDRVSRNAISTRKKQKLQANPRAKSWPKFINVLPTFTKIAAGLLSVTLVWSGVSKLLEEPQERKMVVAHDNQIVADLQVPQNGDSSLNPQEPQGLSYNNEDFQARIQKLRTQIRKYEDTRSVENQIEKKTIAQEDASYYGNQTEIMAEQYILEDLITDESSKIPKPEVTSKEPPERPNFAFTESGELTADDRGPDLANDTVIKEPKENPKKSEKSITVANLQITESKKKVGKYRITSLQVPKLKPIPENSDQFVVIVNKNNQQELSAGDIKNIYLNNITAWDNGERIDLYNLPVDSHIREMFSNLILSTSARAAATKENSRRVSNTLRNASKQQQETLVISRVARNSKAIGYVSKNSLKEIKGLRIIYP